MYKLIIADDEEIVRNGLKNTIEWKKIGVEVIGVAENGYEVLRLIEKNKPHVILTDIRMPEMDGLELAQKVHALYPEIKLILISAYNDFQYAQEAIKYKVKGYLLKPFTEDAFNEVFHSVIKEIQDEENEEKMKQLNKNVILSIQRDQYLKGILKGVKFDKQDPIVRLKELNLSHLDSFNRVVVCNFETLLKGDYNSISMDTFSSKSQDFWEKHNIPCVVYMDYLVVFFNSTKPISKSDTDFYLQRFKQYSKECIGFYTENNEEITIGVGNVYNGIDMIAQSYSEALYSYSFKYFKGNGSIIFYQDLYNKTYSLLNDADINPIIDTLVNNIFTGDHYSLVMDINALFEYIEQKGCFTVNDIQIKFMEIIITIIIKAKEDSIEVKSIDKENAFKSIQIMFNFHDLKLWFKQVVYSLLKEIEESKKRTLNSSNWFVNKTKEYVQQNYSQKISLEEISSHLHMNPNYFSSSFKKATGQSFIDYVNEVKMQKAKGFLKDPEYRIKEIAQKLGYDDFAYFCKVFKKVFAITPLQFRSGLLVNGREERL